MSNFKSMNFFCPFPQLEPDLLLRKLEWLSFVSGEK